MAKYGPYGAVCPDFPGRNVRIEGAPAELSSAPEEVQMVIEAFGGWVAMCREDVEASYFRAQFERLYRGAVDGLGHPDLRRIRLEYQAALPRPVDGGNGRALDRSGGEHKQLTREEAAAALDRIGAKVKRL
jgi:hypothetical protein